MPLQHTSRESSDHFTPLKDVFPARTKPPSPAFSPLNDPWLLKKYISPKVLPSYPFYNTLVQVLLVEPLYTGHLTPERFRAFRDMSDKINGWPLHDWQQLDHIRNLLVAKSPPEHRQKLQEISRMRELAILALARCPEVDPSLNSITRSSTYRPGLTGFSIGPSYRWIVKHDRVGLHAIEKHTVLQLCSLYDPMMFLGVMIDDYFKRFPCGLSLQEMEAVEARVDVYWHGTVWTMDKAFRVDLQLRNNGLTYYI